MVYKLSKNKKWLLPKTDKLSALRISEELNVSPLVANILCARGFDFEDAEKFLFMDNSCFHDPFSLNDMKKAVNRINLAIKQKEKIAVYGDYDVDGITATFILYDYLKASGANVIYYIPDRIDEGYGINYKAIDTLKSQNANLIITVDVGITAIDEVEYAKTKEIDIIVTDHHTLKETIPDAVAVVNPKITSAGYPFDALAGVGVAFKLVYALSGLSPEIFDRYADIAAIGTIADMVPLRGENRYIASRGINALRKTRNKGLKALMSVSGITKEEVSSSDISFSVAPRLNAAGRISHASRSVELLLEKDDVLAMENAIELDSCNKERQQEEQLIFTEAMEIIERKGLMKNDFIVVAKKGWAHGIIGIVSSKITEKFYRPSAVVSINDDGSGKASGRSIQGINLFNALSECQSCLKRFGGHELAAGFTVKEGMLGKFDEMMNEYASSHITDDNKHPTIKIDSFINLSDISLENANSLKVMEPYGIDNRTPILCIENVRISSVRFTQNGKHAFITVTSDGASRELPAFSMADTIREFCIGDIVSVVGTLGINSYKGMVQPQFVVRDIKYSSKDITISRDELKAIFAHIKSKLNNGNNVLCNENFLHIDEARQIKVKNPKIRVALEIFEELGILNISDTENGFIINAGNNFSAKAELTNSKTYLKYNQL